MTILRRIPAALALALVAAAGARADEAADAALAAALAAKDRAAFEAAVAAGAGGGAVPLDEQSLLSVAAAFDAPQAVSGLVTRGLPVDGLDRNGETALFAAAAAGAADAARALLEQGADPGLAVTSRRAPQWTPLLAASASGHDDVVRVLLEAGAGRKTVDVADAHGRTPLFYAALYGQAAAMRLLLEAGASTDVRDAAGDTPASLAGKAGRRGMADVLERFARSGGRP